MKEISSSQNHQFKYWKSLCESKGLKKADHFLISGSKLVEEALNDTEWLSRVEFIIQDGPKFIPSQSHSIELKQVQLSKSLFQELDVLGTGSPILVVQKPKISAWDISSKIDGIKILCPLGDPQNLGAVVRSAYAFGVTSVILLKEAANPFLPKAMKASSGAILKMSFYTGPSIKDICKATHDKSQNSSQLSTIYALDLNGESLLLNKPWPKSFYLLLGEEGPGVPRDFKGERVSIPMKNPMESLNAAVAASIAIFQMSSR